MKRISNLAVILFLSILAVISLGISALAHLDTNGNLGSVWLDGAAQNFGTELLGAILTFGLIEVLVGQRDKQSEQQAAEQKEIDDLFELIRTSDSHTAMNSLSRLYAKGVSLKASNLKGANLGGANLGGAYLAEANLREANFAGADLRDVSLTEANLERANLKGANLGGANLARANLGGANFAGANLETADLKGANLDGTYLKGAHMRYAERAELKANLWNTIFDTTTTLPNSEMWTERTDMTRFTNSQNPEFYNATDDAQLPVGPFAK